jgi:hypothetical protein
VLPNQPSDEQLIEVAKRLQATEGWRCLAEVINRKIDKARDSLEISPTHETTIRLQAKIKALRGVLTFDVK